MSKSAEELLVVRMEATLAKFERQMQRASKVATDTSTGIERRFSASNRKIGQQATEASGAIQRLTNVSGAGRFVLTNTANQIGDIAVQMASGTDAARALSQQLPQMLGGFGALGGTLGIVAPLMGAIAAVGLPLAGVFLATATDAATLADALQGVEKALADTKDLAAIAVGDFDQLREKYGLVTSEILRLVDAQGEIGLRNLADAAKTLRNELTEMYDGNAWLNVSRAEDLGNGLGLATKAARELANMMANLAAQDTIGGQLDAVTAMRERFVQMVGPVNEMTSAQYEFYTALVDAEDKQRQLVKRSTEIKDEVNFAAVAMETFQSAAGASGMVLDGLVGKADALAAAASRAAGAMMAAAQARIDAQAYVDANAPGGTASLASQYAQYGAGRRSFEQAASETGSLYTPFQPPKVVSSGGGGGGRRKSGGGGGGSARAEEPFFADAEKRLRDLQREIDLIGKSSSEVAALKAKWEMLDLAKERNLSLDESLAGSSQTLGELIDAQANAVGALTDQLERQEVAADKLKEATDGIADAFANALVGGQSLRDGLSQVFAQIALDIAKSGFRDLFGGVFGGGGFAGSLLGGIFGGARAAGGPVRAGVPYLVGERGPELVVPRASANIVPAGQTKAAMAGGAQQVVVRLELTDDLNARIGSVSQGVAVETVKAYSRNGGAQADAARWAKDQHRRG